MKLVICPHCDRKQMRARTATGPIMCKFCYKRFEPPAKRRATPARKKR